MDEEEFAKLPEGTMFMAQCLERDWQDYNKRVKGKWLNFMKLDRDNLVVDSMGRQRLLEDLVEGSATVLFTPKNDFPAVQCGYTHQGLSVCPWCGFDPLKGE